MAKQTIPLTDRRIKTIKASDEPVRFFDGSGLYIEVMPSGKKSWRFKSRLRNGKDILMTFGEYPMMSLSEARLERDNARKIIIAGGDPRIVKMEKMSGYQDLEATTFRSIALEWLETRRHSCSERHASAIIRSLKKYIFPVIGERQVDDLTPRHMLRVLQQIEATGHLHTSTRTRSYCSRIFSYAVSIGVLERNPVSELGTLLRKPEHSHFKSISRDELPRLLEGLEKAILQASPSTTVAMLMVILVFARASEIVMAKWDEIDLEKGIWIIPWNRMKMGRKAVNPDRTDHRIDLPRQAVELLKQLHKDTGRTCYVFASTKRNGHPIRTASLNKLLARAGYQGRMTVHGFRALAASSLDEMGFSYEVIEKQLAHKVGSRTFSAYHRAGYYDERKRMLQSWADHIESIQSGLLNLKILSPTTPNA